MKTLAIFGNSHLACVKRAYDQNPNVFEREGVIFDFFGVGGHGIRGFEASGKKLVPDSNELKSQMRRLYGEEKVVDIARYSCFVIVGAQFGFRNVIPFYREFGVNRHLAYRQDIQVVSESCRDATLQDTLEYSNAIHLLAKVREVSNKPVVIASAPFRSERALETAEDSVFESDLKTGYMEMIYREFQSVAERLADDYRFVNCWQNPGTYKVPGFTLDNFSTNGIGFDSKVPVQGDLSHKNIEFGRITAFDIVRCAKEAMDRPRNSGGTLV